jgi:uncharacterized protein
MNASLVQLHPMAAIPATIAEDAPTAPAYHVVEGDPRVLLLVEGSRLFALPENLDVDTAFSQLAPARAPEFVLPREPNAISLNVAQACNLSCTYCYADEGRFGGSARRMSQETAFRAIDRLIAANRGQRASVGFIGGEPMLHRDLVHEATHYAAARARQSGVAVTFGITTNATLLTTDDIELFRSYNFAVTISLDGRQEVNDKQRRSRSGSAYESALRNVWPLLSWPGRARVAARCTLTACDLDVTARVEHLSEAGFREVGVSPLKTSPDPALALRDADWPMLLENMCAAAEADWGRARNGGHLRFSNFAVALKQLAAGACRPLPCGAGASYVSVDVEGQYFTCHRTIGQSPFHLGDADRGPDAKLRRQFTHARLVDTQEPCRRCWARYLCGGGCHAEVIASGRNGCDAIRGWLEFCIRLYPQVQRWRPDLVAHESEELVNG